MQTTSRRRNKGNKKRVSGRWPGRSEQSSFVRCPCVFSLAGCLHSILQRKKGREAEEDPERNVDEPAVSFRSRSCHSSKYALFFFSETNARAFSCVASMRRQRPWPLVTVCWCLFFCRGLILFRCSGGKGKRKRNLRLTTESRKGFIDLAFDKPFPSCVGSEGTRSRVKARRRFYSCEGVV